MATTVVPWTTVGAPPGSPSGRGGLKPVRRNSSLKLGPGSSPGLNVGRLIALRTLQAAGSCLGAQALARRLLPQGGVDGGRAVPLRRAGDALLQVGARLRQLGAQRLGPGAVGLDVGRGEGAGLRAPF